MKEFDIFLRKQPGADIFVYMLTYYLVFLINADGIEIDADIAELLRKFIDADDAMEIDTVVEGVYEKVYENAENELLPEALAEFFAHKTMGDLDELLVQINVDDLAALLRMMLGNIENGIEITAGVDELLEKVYEQIESAVLILAEESGTRKHDFEAGESALELETEAAPLLQAKIDGVCENNIGIYVDRLATVLNWYRRLVDMDGFPLSEFDDMLMADVINIRIE